MSCTFCYNTLLVYILLKQIKFKPLLKPVKRGVYVLLNAVYMHPVEWIKVCVVGGLTSDWSHSTGRI
jgi:hypothetical protein